MDGIEVGIMAHNEAGNLEALLKRLLDEPEAAQICIVSSGSTDGTDQIALRWADTHPQVRAIIEPHRGGKARAINRFLASVPHTAHAVVLISGDVIPDRGSLGSLLAPLSEPGVRMTGGRPCPANPPRGMVNRIVHFQWMLLDRIARDRPKLGEMVAFRPPVDPIDPDTVVDEAALEAQLTRDTGRLHYVPQATLINHGPQCWSDLVAQRERIWIGHRRLFQRTGYRVSTQRIADLCGPALRLLVRHPSWLAVALAAAGVELFARIRGSVRHHLLGELPTIWPRLKSANPQRPLL
jgi:cellulose synthase/poly-beta-1,6-N-acetylglucosamine synthase-like glycosyltransferase